MTDKYLSRSEMEQRVEQRHILTLMAGGGFLKSHRDIEGGKVFKLHPLDGDPEVVQPDVVELLREQGLIDSNKKFPVATFWLTEKGKIVAGR
jgi:hypothetical protein